MKQAQQGDTVKVHYTGRLEDDSVFDQSQENQPLEFAIGEGQIIPGFENGVIGMSVGEKKRVSVEPEAGYGPQRDELVAEVKRESFPEHITPEIGQVLQIQQPNGQNLRVNVTAVEDDVVILDANHPLAGKPLVFDVELVEIA